MTRTSAPTSTVHLLGGGWHPATAAETYGPFLASAGDGAVVATVVLDEGDGSEQFARWDEVLRGTAACTPVPVLVPEGGVLHAELFVPSRAIGFVAVGQRVRLLYDAFPYQHYGTYAGRIVRVSQTILAGTDISVPLTLEGPAYRAVVELEQPDVDVNGKRVPLQPDMLLKADIILERRTLIDWMLNPVTSARIQG